jgi:hypothetical protein
MTITLSAETQKLIEQRMKETGVATADEVVRIALKTLHQVQGEDYEDLDPSLRQSIEEAEAEYVRGEGMPADEAFAKLREKYACQLKTC